MTEQAGYLNALDLVEECVERMQHDAYLWSKRAGGMNLPEECPYSVLSQSVLSVLRKRGLLTLQALELLADN